MRAYLSPADPVLQRHGAERDRTLLSSLTVSDGVRDGVRVWTVPAGFRTDLASVPRAVWAVLAPEDLSDGAPLCHDWLYRRGGWAAPHIRYTRAQADDLFRRLMLQAGVRGWKRRAAFLAVRLFGGRAWQRFDAPPEMQEAA